MNCIVVRCVFVCSKVLPTPTLDSALFALFHISLICTHAGTFLCVGFHCRRVVCACSAGAVGSFSNKPLSPKVELRVRAAYPGRYHGLRRRGIRLESDRWRPCIKAGLPPLLLQLLAELCAHASTRPVSRGAQLCSPSAQVSCWDRTGQGRSAAD